MNSDKVRIANGLHSLAILAERTVENTEVLGLIVSAMRTCLESGGTLFFAGNGGSAADAQHIAAEYVVRYHKGIQKALRAIALTTDTSILTAAGNDLGYEWIFDRQLDALGRPEDVLTVHSTSGDSLNCIRAVQRANRIGMATIAFLGGDGGKLKDMVHYPFIVDDTRTSHVQEIHLAVQHQIAEILTTEYSWP